MLHSQLTGVQYRKVQSKCRAEEPGPNGRNGCICHIIPSPKVCKAQITAENYRCYYVEKWYLLCNSCGNGRF